MSCRGGSISASMTTLRTVKLWSQTTSLITASPQQKDPSMTSCCDFKYLVQYNCFYPLLPGGRWSNFDAFTFQGWIPKQKPRCRRHVDIANAPPFCKKISCILEDSLCSSDSVLFFLFPLLRLNLSLWCVSCVFFCFFFFLRGNDVNFQRLPETSEISEIHVFSGNKWTLQPSEKPGHLEDCD